MSKCSKNLVESGIADVSLPSQARKYILEIKAKSRFNQKDITSEFEKYIEDHAYEHHDHSEFYNIFARYLDRKSESFEGNLNTKHLYTINLAVNMFYKSIRNNNQFLWQALPRMLEIWFNLAKRSKIRSNDIRKTTEVIEKLETYQIAQVFFYITKIGLNFHFHLYKLFKSMVHQMNTNNFNHYKSDEPINKYVPFHRLYQSFSSRLIKSDDLRYPPCPIIRFSPFRDYSHKIGLTVTVIIF